MRHLRKATLFLVMSALFLSSALHATTPAPKIMNPDSLQWSAAADLPPGATVAILSGNPAKKEPFVARVKLPANYYIPAHAHPVNETETVLSGTLYLGLGTKKDLEHGQALTVGSFVMIPAKCAHYTWTKEETIVQISAVGPWGMLYTKQS